MTSVLLGVAVAALAAGLYAVGVALQALEARAAPASERLRPALVRRLGTRPRWLAGTACAVLAWIAQTVALSVAPLTLVQPILALALVVLLAIGKRLLAEPVGAREVAAVAAIVAGILGLAWASPTQPSAPASPGVLAAVLAAFACLALIPYALRRYGGGPNLLVTLGGGLGFAWAALASSFVADAVTQGAWLVVPVALAVALAGAGVGLLNEMTALQSGAAVRVYPTVLMVQIVVAVLLAPLLVGESWDGTPFGGLAVVASLAVLIAAAAVLSAGSAVGRASAATSAS